MTCKVALKIMAANFGILFSSIILKFQFLRWYALSCEMPSEQMPMINSRVRHRQKSHSHLLLHSVGNTLRYTSCMLHVHHKNIGQVSKLLTFATPSPYHHEQRQAAASQRLAASHGSS